MCSRAYLRKGKAAAVVGGMEYTPPIEEKGKDNGAMVVASARSCGLAEVRAAWRGKRTVLDALNGWLRAKEAGGPVCCAGLQLRD